MKTISIFLLLLGMLFWTPASSYAEQKAVQVKWSLKQDVPGLAGFHLYESGVLVYTVPIQTIPNPPNWEQSFTMNVIADRLSFVINGYDANETDIVASVPYLIDFPKITSFSATPQNPSDPNIAVSFVAVASTSSGSPLTYLIDFGDGSALKEGASSTHTYTSAGTYHATVTVKDQYGNTVLRGVDITVTNTIPPKQVQGVTIQ